MAEPPRPSDVPRLPGEDPLEALSISIEATRRAAERLAYETAQSMRASAAGHAPPRGWEVPPSGPSANRELQALVGLADTVREALPDHVRRQLTELIRQLLTLLRTLIDWWIARLQAPEREDVSIEEIPIL